MSSEHSQQCRDQASTIYIAFRKDEETMTDGASTIYEITPYIVDSVASTATVE